MMRGHAAFRAACPAVVHAAELHASLEPLELDAGMQCQVRQRPNPLDQVARHRFFEAWPADEQMHMLGVR
ncbi:hypothetical protein D3C81_1392350 [compost metagenome]